MNDKVGEYLRAKGNEFGATTGRPRRTGWFDAAALKRAIQINGVSGLCITKLDVLDGMETVRVCTGYRLDGEVCDLLPIGAEEAARCEPVYEDWPGWSESTVGIRNYQSLPQSARRYLERIEAVTGVPIHVVSTSPDRDHTILLRNPFEA